MEGIKGVDKMRGGQNNRRNNYRITQHFGLMERYLKEILIKVLRGGVTMRISTGWNDYYQMLQVFFLLLGVVFIILGLLFWSFASVFFSAAICCAIIVFVQLWICGSYLMKKSNIDNISNQRGEDEIYDNWIKVNENGFWKKTNNEDEPGNNFNRYAWSIAKFKPKGSSTDRLYVGTASLLPRLSNLRFIVAVIQKKGDGT